MTENKESEELLFFMWFETPARVYRETKSVISIGDTNDYGDVATMTLFSTQNMKPLWKGYRWFAIPANSPYGENSDVIEEFIEF